MMVAKQAIMAVLDPEVAEVCPPPESLSWRAWYMGSTVPSGRTWQDLPEYPGRHLHWKSAILLMQNPLLRQGLRSHSLTSVEQSFPVNPVGQ